jgi:HAD superfamily hydrolase (TIGR01544 family)
MTGLSIEPGTDFIRYLENHAVHIRNSAELRDKILEIAADGPENFQVISDFDKTLTPQWLKDPCSKTGALRACHASHGVIETSPFVSREYATHTKQLASHYIPLEHDIHLSREEKTKICEEWYHKAHDLMLLENITDAKLDKIVETCWSSMEIHLRAETKELIEACSRAQIPLTVLSAGLADVIERILRLEDVHGTGDIIVVGNRMYFDSNGRHEGFSEPVIHTLNKRGALTESIVSSSNRASRKNALLMGDMIGDVDFVHSVPHLSQYIAIGFLADGPDHEKRLEEYLKHFDVVIIGGSASMGVPLELIRALF